MLHIWKYVKIFVFHNIVLPLLRKIIMCTANCVKYIKTSITVQQYSFNNKAITKVGLLNKLITLKFI